MGGALYIVPETKLEGFDDSVNGKALGRVPAERLERLADLAHVRPLAQFFSMRPEDALAFFEDIGAEPPAEGFKPTAWFSAEEGLAAVCGLREHLQAHPKRLPDSEEVVADLLDFERVLSRLAKDGIRWRLAVGF